MNTRCAKWFVLLCFVLLLCPAGFAAAQGAGAPATNLSALQRQLLPGMEVTAIDNKGKELKGQVAEITDAVLVIDNGGTRYSLSHDTLAELRQRKPDSLLNGALIGAATAGGTMALLLASWCNGEDCGSGAVIGYTALYTGVGAGIGILIDSLIKSEVVMYRHPAMKVAVGLTGNESTPGVSLSMRW